ncbi:MAG: hypothetical protein WDA25_00220 [Paracoccaceae bacterium]
MKQKTGKSAGRDQAGGREARLKAALKANMARRKAQARARAAEADAANPAHRADDNDKE